MVKQIQIIIGLQSLSCTNCRRAIPHFGINDLSKLIPTADVDLVKLEVKNDKSACYHDHYQFRLEYELKQNHELWTVEIDLIISKSKIVQQYELSFKSQVGSHIHPFEI